MSWGTGRTPRPEPGGISQREASPIAETLRRQFRHLARNLARQFPVPHFSSRKRRKGETVRAFSAAAALFTRRAPVLAVQARQFIWNALNWLQLWAWNISDEAFQQFDAKDQQHLAPHL
jgi:hypothetical protein